MDRISAVLITKDEARNVERCLASLAPVADEIVVVDGFSTDDTVARCERLGARVVRHAWLGFGPQKNLANGLARHGWILSVDADEALDPFLQRAVAEAKAKGLRGAYEVSRLNWYYGRFVRHGLEYPDRKVRLFPRDKVRWNDALVHEGLVFAEPLAVTRLDGHLLHYTYGRVAEHVAKQDRYTSLAAEDAFRRGVRPSLVKLLLSPLAVLLKSYLLRRGFLDGVHGLVLSVLHAHGTFLKNVKLWDAHRAAREAAGGDGAAGRGAA
ncbi:MAG TPA: glycosyltransferase family 2 protein [Anaeromyxobacter sp.]|nr:glycosyltransferase family 2 protein [Anaeromyxobacter sp.]